MFDFQIAIRFLREGKMQTLLIILGIAVGISVQIFLSALIAGLQADLIQTTVGQSPHITARAGQQLMINPIRDLFGESVIDQEISYEMQETRVNYWPEIVAQLEKVSDFKVVSPLVSGSGFVQRGERSLPVVVQGFDLIKADQIYQIERRMVEGSYSAGGNEVLIGADLAKELQLTAGDIIRVSNPAGILDNFRVAGIFDLENKLLNETWLIMALPRAQTFFELTGTLSAIQIQLFDVFQAERIAGTLAPVFTEFSWISWQEENEALLVGLQSQSSSSLVIQVFVLIAVTMGISSVLAVTAVQKSKQIGILKALGTRTSSVIRIFLIQGGMLGFVGASVGCVLGVVLIRSFLYFSAASDGTPLFPITLEPALFAASLGIATVAGTVAAGLPALKTAKLNPAEVIKNG